MSSSTTVPSRRSHLGRIKRIALTAGAVTVGAIILSGCVVIQSESALQSTPLANSITVTTTLCASQAAAAAPCNGPGISNAYAAANATGTASAPGQLLLGYRIPVGVSAPPTLATSVATVDENGAAITVPLTMTQNAAYAAGLSSILPPPAGTAWVGYVSEVNSYKQNGPQAVSVSPTFGLPDGFVGPFNWRTVVGYRSSFFQNQDPSCPGAFPGAIASPIPGQSSVCVDYPDAGTIQGNPSSYATGSLSIVAPATPTVTAGSAAMLAFTGLFGGSNPSGAVFAAAATTTIPGVTPSVTPTFAPGPNSSNPLTVTFGVPASTPVGTYDVTVSATVAGVTRSGVGHITIKAPVKSVVTATTGVAGKKAKLTSSVRSTTLKAARKTGIPLTLTLSRASSISVVALQTKPKVSVTVKKKLKANKKTVVLVKSARLHKGKVTITFKGGGLTRTIRTTLK